MSLETSHDYTSWDAPSSEGGPTMKILWRHNMIAIWNFIFFNVCRTVLKLHRIIEGHHLNDGEVPFWVKCYDVIIWLSFYVIVILYNIKFKFMIFRPVAAIPTLIHQRVNFSQRGIYNVLYSLDNTYQLYLNLFRPHYRKLNEWKRVMELSLLAWNFYPHHRKRIQFVASVTPLW